MLWFSQYGAKWTRKATFLTLVILLLLLISCATVLSSKKFVGTPLDSKDTVQPEEPFPTRWEKCTIQLGERRGTKAPLQILNPLNMIEGMGRGGGESQFPLLITATLMDTILIEAGLQHYSTLINMTPEEKEEFRSSYFQRYDVENHLLIWCEIQTFWSELYLNLNRWIIFIQDDAGNQYEPKQILEEENKAPEFSRNAKNRFPELQPEARKSRWEIHQKSLMLCFPKRDFLKKPVLSERVRFLKLVFQLNEEGEVRAEGIWVFKE